MFGTYDKANIHFTCVYTRHLVRQCWWSHEGGVCSSVRMQSTGCASLRSLVALHCAGSSAMHVPALFFWATPSHLLFKRRHFRIWIDTMQSCLWVCCQWENNCYLKTDTWSRTPQTELLPWDDHMYTKQPDSLTQKVHMRLLKIRSRKKCCIRGLVLKQKTLCRLTTAYRCWGKHDGIQCGDIFSISTCTNTTLLKDASRK